MIPHDAVVANPFSVGAGDIWRGVVVGKQKSVRRKGRTLISEIELRRRRPAYRVLIDASTSSVAKTELGKSLLITTRPLRSTT
jgi:hypothetical protein